MSDNKSVLPWSLPEECEICGSKPFFYRWSDLHGQGMCNTCGLPYQLRDISKEKNRKVPYTSVYPQVIIKLKEYYQETKKQVWLGIFMGKRPQWVINSIKDFEKWVDQKYPKFFEELGNEKN